MKITNEPYQRDHWTEALKALPIKEKCLTAELSNYGTLRTTATRLHQKLGLKYSFERTESTVKVWRIQ